MLRGIIVAILFASAATARRAPSSAGAGDVVEPEIVVPGEWQTDKAEKYLFLPLTVPKSIRINQCKIMTNGESLLVVVTERPEEEPDTNAMRKYKMIIEAIKGEVANDETLLRSKLQTWLDTEDDDEVRVHVRDALNSLDRVRIAKKNDDPRTLTLRLGLSQHTSFLGRNATKNATIALPAVQKRQVRRQRRTGIIKESFAVEIPYPVPQERLFLLQTSPTTVVAGMPLVRESLEASGVSTGGKPFTRVPVFGTNGELLAGPTVDVTMLTQGLNLHELGELLPLTE